MSKLHRLPSREYPGYQLYFVTICCCRRQLVFADISLGHWALDLLLAAAHKHHFTLHAFCLMPDHLHLLAEGGFELAFLLRFLAAYKQQTAFIYLQRQNCLSGSPNPMTISFDSKKTSKQWLCIFGRTLSEKASACSPPTILYPDLKP
jgi:REP element-mobilizing transposase RayT